MSTIEGATPGLSRRVEKLNPGHAVVGFDCGQEQLNQYLVRYAWTNQQAGAGQTYVGPRRESGWLGYYTLAVGHILQEQAPERVVKGLAHHPVPMMLLARMAVDQRWQGRGIGKALLKDAMLRTLQAADIAGIRALAVHAKDQRSRSFYEKYDFVPSPTDPLPPVRSAQKTVRRTFSAE